MSRHNKAFSLIELLLGLAITAIIGVALYTIFWTGLKLDDRTRISHDQYVELLIAFDALQQDLQAATNIDLSANYKNLRIFEGKTNEFSFLRSTPTGIVHLRYHAGLVDFGKVTTMLINKRISNKQQITISSVETSPIEFLLRESASMPDWANGLIQDNNAEIIATGLMKETVKFEYAPLPSAYGMALVYQDSWNQPGLPLAVKCTLTIYNAKRPENPLEFTREILLTPVISK